MIPMIHSMEQRNSLLSTMMVAVTRQKKYQSADIEDTVFQLNYERENRFIFIYNMSIYL